MRGKNVSNIDYFKFSQTHDDEILDESRPEGSLVININPSEPKTPLMKANEKLIDLISKYKEIKDNGTIDDGTKINILDSIINIIENTRLINYSPFCVYFQVIGYSYSAYMNEKDSMTSDEKREKIDFLLNLYIQYRHELYLNHGYSDQILQVLSDAASSKRKGKTGIIKIEEILKPLKFTRAKKMIDLNYQEFCYILPDKGDGKLFDDFLFKHKIAFDFSKVRDNKKPDMLFKIKNDFFILEHKLTNGGGGSQNQEINEIIQFINYEETSNNWHYISCLQGDYFKRINKTNTEPKVVSQYKNITDALSLHPGNYFVNGKGFEKLIKDLVPNDDALVTFNNYSGAKISGDN